MKKSLKFILNLLSILILLSILFSYAMFQGGFVSWFLFSSFLPIFIYHLGFLMYPIKNWKVSRQLSQQTIRAGESLNVSIKIQRKIPFPIYYCVVEEGFSHTLDRIDSGREKYHYLNQPNKLRIKRKVTKAVFPWFKRNIHISYSLDQIPRGKHTFKEIRLKTGDVFGFVKKEHVFQVENELIVKPSQLPIRLSHKINHFEHGTVASGASFRNTNIAVGVREYEPGDRFSWIDWKQTAKKNTIMTKEFEQEKSSNILLILDSCFYPGLNPLAFEASIELTLGLIDIFRKRHTKVSLLTIGGEDGNAYYSMGQEKWDENRMVNHLTMIQPEGKLSFTVQLKEQILRMNSEDMVFVVTTHMDEEFKQTFDQMNKRMNQIVVLLIQSASFIPGTERFTMEGNGVHIITEEHLKQRMIEVDVK